MASMTTSDNIGTFFDAGIPDAANPDHPDPVNAAILEFLR
jgi:hypothetical protein